MSELANIRITRETLRIVAESSYRVDGKAVRFPDVDFRAAEV